MIEEGYATYVCRLYRIIPLELTCIYVFAQTNLTVTLYTNTAISACTEVYTVVLESYILTGDYVPGSSELGPTEDIRHTEGGAGREPLVQHVGRGLAELLHAEVHVLPTHLQGRLQ